MSDFPTPEEIINGTYKPKSILPEGTAADTPEPKVVKGIVIPVPDNFAPSDEMAKALSLIVSGMPFVLVAIEETFTGTDLKNATGADLFTVLNGSKDTLRAVSPQLPGAIERAYMREGIV